MAIYLSTPTTEDNPILIERYQLTTRWYEPSANITTRLFKSPNFWATDDWDHAEEPTYGYIHGWVYTDGDKWTGDLPQIGDKITLTFWDESRDAPTDPDTGRGWITSGDFTITKIEYHTYGVRKITIGMYVEEQKVMDNIVSISSSGPFGSIDKGVAGVYNRKNPGLPPTIWWDKDWGINMISVQYPEQIVDYVDTLTILKLHPDSDIGINMAQFQAYEERVIENFYDIYRTGNLISEEREIVWWAGLLELDSIARLIRPQGMAGIYVLAEQGTWKTFGYKLFPIKQFFFQRSNNIQTRNWCHIIGVGKKVEEDQLRSIIERNH
jgi:hypothetical protein